MNTDNLLKVLDSFEERILDYYRSFSKVILTDFEYYLDFIAHQEIFINFKDSVYGSDCKIDSCLDFLESEFKKVVVALKIKLRALRLELFLDEID